MQSDWIGDSNPIHMIQILLYVTLFYADGINEVYTVIILRNTCMFAVRFVLFSGYYSSLLHYIIIKI